MIELKDNTFVFTSYKVSFMDDDNLRVNYSSDRQHYEKLVARWGHLTNLKFEPVVPTQEQQNRLDTINAIDDPAKFLHTYDCNLFVQFNAVHPENQAQFLEQFRSPETENNMLEVYKTELKDAARKKRWEVETSGITVDGINLRTDEKSQTRIANLVTTVIADEESQEFHFESDHGVWSLISRATAVAIGKAVSRHVQACFTHCKEIHEEIDAASFATLENVDINSGWPS